MLASEIISECLAKGADMKKVALVLISFALFTLQVQAEELTEQKKQAINDLLELSGTTAEYFDAMEKLLTALKPGFKKLRPDVDPRIVDIVMIEVAKTVRQKMKGELSFNKMLEPIFHKKFSLNEIREIIRFYETPVGRKLISHTPALDREFNESLKFFMKGIQPMIQENVLAALKEQGIK